MENMEVTLDRIEDGDRRRGLNIKEHLKYIWDKASVTQGALASTMPNIGGPGPFKGE